MKRIITTILLLVALAAGQASRQAPLPIIQSGGSVKIQNPAGAFGASFEEVPLGSPASVSITIQGCMQRGNTCDVAADTNTSTAAAIRGVTFTKVYDYFLVTATWSGGSNVSIQINATVSSASSHTVGSGITATLGTPAAPAVYSSANALGSSTIYFDASQYAGATVDVKVNACLAAALTAHGTCDARAITGPQTVAAEIDVGDSAGDPVTLLLPTYGSWIGTMTDGTSCTIKHFVGSSIIGSGASGVGNTFNIQAGSSSNLGYIYCTAGASSGYLYASGFGVYNSAASGHTTANGIGALITGAFDASSWNNIAFLDNKDAVAVKVYGVCCSASFNSVSIASTYNTGSTPLQIVQDNSSPIARPQVVSFNNVSVDHPGSSQPIVSITDTSTQKSLTVNFTNMYSETSNSDTTTAFVQIAGAQAVNVTNWAFHAGVASVTATAFTVTSAKNTLLTITGLTMGIGGGSFTYPATAVNDSFTGVTKLTDSIGNLAFFGSNVYPTHYSAIPSADSCSSACTFATTISIPGNTAQPGLFSIGTTLKIRAHGNYTTGSTASPVLTIVINAGGTSGICPNNASPISLSTNQTNNTWDAECFIQIDTLGNSGTSTAMGPWSANSAGGTQIQAKAFNNTGTVTYNTNAAETVSIAEAATAVSGQTFTLTELDVQIMP